MLGLALTAVAAAAASAAGYQSMAPTGQWYGKTFTGLGRGSKQLALTYDDGPNDPHTLRLLEVLAKHDVRATFFLIGRYVRQRPDMVRELVKAGHVAAIAEGISAFAQFFSAKKSSIVTFPSLFTSYWRLLVPRCAPTPAIAKLASLMVSVPL